MTTSSQVRWLSSLLLAGALVVSVASGARADGPLTPKGNVVLNAKAHGLALRNNLAYVATEKGLTILHIATPDVLSSIQAVGVLQPKPGFTSTLMKSQAVAVEGDYAYLAGGYLIVVDISNPALPDPVGKLAIPGGLWDVVVKNNVIYGVGLAGELYVICAASPPPGCPAGASHAAPKIARVIGLPAWANAGADLVNLKRLCPPDGTPPCDQPALTSGNGRATGISLAGDRLFAVEWAYGRLYHFEIATEPLHPRFVSTHYAPYLIKAHADLDQEVVYMLTAFGAVSGLRSVPFSVLDDFVSSRYNDINTCGVPTVCGYLKSDLAIDQGDLAIAGNKYVVYAGGKGAGELHVVDTVPTMQNEATKPNGIGLHGVGMAHGMAIRTHGDFVFQAAGVLGLQVNKFSNLSQ